MQKENLVKSDGGAKKNIFYTINWREFACGYGAAAINVSITYPINKIIFRQVCVE